MNAVKEYKNNQLASIWSHKFKEALVSKASYTRRWIEYIDAYNGDYFKGVNLPSYKSDFISNYIFSIVETIRPIMLDNNPKFQAMPRHPEGMMYSTDMQEALSYEWDREDMSSKLSRELINSLVIGNNVFFLPWNSDKKDVNSITVNPFNIFPDPLATCVDDAEYIIYASYQNHEILRRMFPKYADKLVGGNVNYSELVYNNDRDAKIDNQILVLEVFTMDYESEEIKDGDYKKIKPKYPNGRQITVCPDLGLILDDKAIPYKDDFNRFPFVIGKDYDIPGKFWGEGEVAQLISPQKYMNEINNAIIDHAKTTANSPWVIDKNSGIGQGKITSQQGLIIRKNPGSEVTRIQPPGMPNYVINAVETFKGDMNEISGVFNTLKGNSETGVYTAQGILALQEAGQARIRLKVKVMEEYLGRIARMWFSRMRQYWSDDKFIRIVRHDGAYDVKMFKNEALDYDYDIRICAGSTMPVNRSAMLDLMIRLAQTQMPDGQPLVDREAVAQYLPEEIKAAMLKRMSDKSTEIQQQIEGLGQALQQLQQQLQQFAQQNQQDDSKTMQTVEQLVQAVEAIKSEIVQLEQKHDRLEQEKKENDKLDKIRTESYNNGYNDAEKIYTDDSVTSDEVSSGKNNSVDNSPMGLPDDILSGLEGMTEDELALIMDKNPQLIELLNQSGAGQL